jgi:hypothetical protein
MTATVRVDTTWVTSVGQRVEHAVVDDGPSGLSRSSGVFTAVCGACFLPASMRVAPGVVCSSCRLLLEARESKRTVEARLGSTRHRLPRLGRFARLWTALFASDVPPVATSSPGARQA